MKIYGYTKTNYSKLLTLREATIQCNVGELEAIIQFLNFALDEMKTHNANFGHEHLTDWLKANKRTPFDGDIIVIAEPKEPGTGST